MAIVTVKNKYQVEIPPTARKALGINQGDLLEARVERGKLTYTRKTFTGRIPAGKEARARFLRELRAGSPEWLQEMWAESKRAGLDKMTMREINDEIAVARREKSAKRTSKQPSR